MKADYMAEYIGVIPDLTPAASKPDAPKPAKAKASGRWKLLRRFWRAPTTPDLTPAAKLTWLFLWTAADQRRICWPSQRRIAEHLGLSARHIRRALTELQRAGYLTVLRTGTNKGVNRANMYRIGVHHGDE